jgi:hypothetical protein
LAAIAIPNFVRARKTAQANSCTNNLRLIDAAKQQLALEDPSSAIDQGTITPYLGRGAGEFPECPTTKGDGGASYTVGADTDTAPVCANDDAANGFAHALPTVGAIP